MNQINRIEETWTPQWDLGLQDSFGFMEARSGPEGEKEEEVPRSGWSLAVTEVLNRQTQCKRRIDAGPNSIGALISFFESEFSAEGGCRE